MKTVRMAVSELWDRRFQNGHIPIQAKNGAIPKKSKGPFKSVAPLRFPRASDGDGVGESGRVRITPFEPLGRRSRSSCHCSIELVRLVVRGDRDKS
jgi:hypothetical protein